MKFLMTVPHPEGKKKNKSTCRLFLFLGRKISKSRTSLMKLSKLHLFPSIPQNSISLPTDWIINFISGRDLTLYEDKDEDAEVYTPPLPWLLWFHLPHFRYTSNSKVELSQQRPGTDFTQWKLNCSHKSRKGAAWLPSPFSLSERFPPPRTGELQA